VKRFAAALLCVGAAALGSAARPRASAPTRSDRWVEKTLRSMSLDEKIGQMIFPAGPPAGGFRPLDSDAMDTIRRNIVEFHVGGYHTFGGDPAGNAVTINEMQRMAKIPLLITADLEGGPGYVLFGATRLPLAMAMGATGDERLAFEAGKLTAQEARAIGIHVDFYPVADVNNNPENPIINIRSFGEDPASVSRFVRAYIRGAQENGVIATAKHFPGHGDVTADSHLQMPVLEVPKARLEALEWPPFRAAIDEDVGAVMSAHIWLPKLEPEKGLPSTLSKTILGGVLRDELGFKGLVFTDAMTMKGVSANYGDADASVRAVEAGVDVLLHPPSIETSFNALKAAVAGGRISESRIDQSVRRILAAKAKLKLTDPRVRFTDVDRLPAVVGTREHRDLAQRIADNAVTLVRDEQHVLPLEPSPDLRVAQIIVLDTRNGWREGPVGRVMTAELQQRFPRAVTVQIDDQSTPNELDIVRKLAQLSDAVVVDAFIRVAAYKGSIDLTPAQIKLLRDLFAMKKPFVFTEFGSPYVLTHITDLPSYIVTYDISPAAEMAAVRAITGEIEFRGKLPISLPGLYPVGQGLTAPRGSSAPK
jgi:beta-N-acetylhexosaminidase